MPLTVTLTDVLRANNLTVGNNIHTSLPGKVVRYNAAKKTADVQPAVNNVLYDTAGVEISSERLPIIPDVPVSFPRGGGWHLSFPLAPGDHVTLVFAESATGQWRVTGEVSDPSDARRHSLASPTAFPGAHTDAALLSDDTTYTNTLVLGRDGTPSQSVRIGGGTVACGGTAALALSDNTRACLTQLANMCAALQVEVVALQAALAGGGPPTAAAAAISASTVTTQTGNIAGYVTAYGVAYPLVPSTVTKGQ